MRQARALRVAPVLDVGGPKLSVRGVAKSYRNARGTVISACTDVTFDVTFPSTRPPLASSARFLATMLPLNRPATVTFKGGQTRALESRR